jgi:hypothetical protein
VSPDPGEGLRVREVESKPRLEWLLLFVPVSLALSLWLQELAVFFTSALAILPSPH